MIKYTYRNEMENKLIKDFPFMIFNNECFPMEWGDGWLELFYNMCFELKEELDKYDYTNEFHWLQLKEKFGSARCYYNSCPTESKVEEIIDKFESNSQYVCELCGNKGEIREDIGWMTCLCDKDYNIIKEKYGKNSI